MKSKILNRTEFFHNRVFSLEMVQMKMPNGAVDEYSLVMHPGSVTIIPLDEKENIHFVRQYRVGPNKVLLELPAGTLEMGESPRKCALREIREEVGMAAGKLIELGDLYLCPGYSSEHMHIFLAVNLTPSPLKGDEDEILEPERIPFSQVKKMIANNQINDGKSLAALLIGWEFIQKAIGNKGKDPKNKKMQWEENLL